MKEPNASPKFPRPDPQSGRIHSERALFEEMERAAELLQSEQDYGRSGIRSALLACHSFLHVRGLSGQGLKPLIDLLSAFKSVEESTLPEIFDPKMRPGAEPTRKWSRAPSARETKIYVAACLDALMNAGISEMDAASKIAKSVPNWPRISVGMIKASTVANWRDELKQKQSSDRERRMFEKISRDFSEGPRAASYLKEVLRNGPPMTGGIYSSKT